MICLCSCWIQDAVAIQGSLEKPLSVTGNDSKIYIAQNKNKITIDEVSYDDIMKRKSRSSDLIPPYKQRRKHGAQPYLLVIQSGILIIIILLVLR